MVRTNTGRKKVVMAKIKNEKNLLVTFSKRKAGLFKKASELSTLCGIQIAVVVFSPSGKVFSFGHPDANILFDHCSRVNLINNNTSFAQSNSNSKLQLLNNFLTEATVAKEKEQRNKKMLAQQETLNRNPKKWWTNPPETLNLSQSTDMKHALEDLMKQAHDVYSLFLQTIPNFYVGSSSNVTPGAVNGGNIYTNQGLFGHNPETSPGRVLPFEYKFLNGIPAGHNYKQGFEHARPPHHGPRYN